MIKDYAFQYLTEIKKVIEIISLNNLDEIVRTILDAHDRDSSIFVMGNGGSGSTASHFTCDINKGVSLGLEKRFKFICLNDNIPTILAYANDISYEDIFVEQLKNFLKPNDVVIGISGSGNSKNVIKAIRYANESQAVSVGFTGFDGGTLAKIAKISIVVPINDMQIVEDMHSIMTHMIMQILYKKLRQKDELDEYQLSSVQDYSLKQKKPKQLATTKKR